MCKVFQDRGHANRNTHYILILGRKYEEFFVVLLSFLHNTIYSRDYIHSVVTLCKEIHVRLTINRLLIFKTFLQQNYCEKINQDNDQYSRSPIKRPLSCTKIISICLIATFRPNQSDAVMKWIMPDRALRSSTERIAGSGYEIESFCACLAVLPISSEIVFSDLLLCAGRLKKKIEGVKLLGLREFG